MLNHETLFAALQPRIEAAVAASQPLGLLVIRLQRMRDFGQMFGYRAVDRATDALQAELEAALRPDDALFRIGEASFAAIIPGLRNRQHLALAAAKLIRVLHAPLHVDQQPVLAPVLVGGATCPEDGTDPDTLCRHADIACNQAAATSERFALYEASALSASFAHGDLRDAIATNAMQLFLQPIASLGNGAVVRVEALSRWTHPTLGNIAPDVFIRVAEQTGLIADLTRWSFNLALRHAAESHGISVSVNLSVRVLQQPGFVEQVGDLLRLWRVDPKAIVLEVTESGLMENLAQCAHLLARLREMGFGIAIDDFGTGYSSMAYLKRLPVTELKIDRSFVSDMVDDPRTEKLVGSMIDLSHQLGMEVVAEGVEDATTLERLRGLGCDFAQGYHIGPPAPAAEVLSRLLAGQHQRTRD